jgi:Zn-dependent protease with chaperone function
MGNINEVIESNNITNKFGKLLNVNFFIWFTLFAIGLGISSFYTFGFALLAGILGAVWSLLFAKSLAKKAHGVETIHANNSEYAGLYEMVKDLSTKAGIPTPEVGIYESNDMNAFATGISQSNSLLAFSTALLEKMSISEIQAVAAHEIGHIVSRDMIAMSLFQGTISAVVLFFTFPIQIFRVLNIFTNNNGTVWTLEAFAWFVKYIAMIVLTFFGSIVLNTFSRKREFRADAIASILVGKRAMISALNTLSHDTELPAKSQMSYNSMKISAPQAFMEWFSTHPAIEKCTQALEFETYSRLANEKNILSRTTASILGISLCFVGGHHFYMRRPVWSLPNMLMLLFSLPVVLAEIYTYWTQSNSDEEFDEKFVKQDGAKKIRLIALPITFMAFLIWATNSDSKNTDQNVNIENAVPQATNETITPNVAANTPISSQQTNYIFEQPVRLVGVLGSGVGGIGEEGDPNFKKITYPLLILSTAISVTCSNADECSPVEGTSEIQLSLSESNMKLFKQNKGKSVVVTGTLTPMMTAHHYTPAIMMVDTLTLQTTSTNEQSQTIPANVETLVNKWNDAHNTQNANLFSQIFAQSVKFYGAQLSVSKVVSAKITLMQKYPNFHQEIVNGIICNADSNPSTYRCEFTKRVVFGDKTKDYPSYLMIDTSSQEAKVIVESDVITDRNLKQTMR